MALIVEENEKKSNVFAIVGWLIFLGIAAAAVYYLFFEKPELVVIPSSGTLSAITPITQTGLDPATVAESPAFRALTSTVALPMPDGPVTIGRVDPFIAP
jgi:hypothetical protein